MYINTSQSKMHHKTNNIIHAGRCSWQRHRESNRILLVTFVPPCFIPQAFTAFELAASRSATANKTLGAPSRKRCMNVNPLTPHQRTVNPLTTDQDWQGDAHNRLKVRHTRLVKGRFLNCARSGLLRYSRKRTRPESSQEPRILRFTCSTCARWMTSAHRMLVGLKPMESSASAWGLG